MYRAKLGFVVFHKHLKTISNNKGAYSYKKHTQTNVLSSVVSLSILISVFSFSAAALESEIQEPAMGNVPVRFTPNSNITFNADGSYEVTYVAEPTPASQEGGVEIAGFDIQGDPDEMAAENEAIIAEFESLPVYTYEQYYIAKEGAVAQYDQNGELIRVRGDAEYHSTLDQYKVNGILPNGRYVGTYLEFAHINSIVILIMLVRVVWQELKKLVG